MLFSPCIHHHITIEHPKLYLDTRFESLDINEGIQIFMMTNLDQEYFLSMYTDMDVVAST